MIEYLPLVLTGLGLTASIIYYTSVLRNANKTQQMQLETRQAQLFHGIYTSLDDDWWNAYHLLRNTEWTDYSDFSNKALPINDTELGRAYVKLLITRARSFGTCDLVFRKTGDGWRIEEFHVHLHIPSPYND